VAYWNVLRGVNPRPKFVRTGPVLAHRTTVDQLPQLVCWLSDGGAS
jgi:4-hydroxy-3-polyprenylbenzoate decarboxylase